MQFDQIIGLVYLYALHVNDSITPFGGRKDHHANLGHGEIGMSCFKAMMQHPILRPLPKYLETPKGDSMWAKEIKLLESYL